MRKYVLLVAIVTATLSCGNNQKASTSQESSSETAQAEVDMHNAENSLDFCGVYEGTLPAASSPGINMMLTLNKDKTFSSHTEYIDEKDGVFDNKGSYVLEGNILTLKQDDGEIFYYKVEEGRVRMLNKNKEAVTGELADHYVLKQTNAF